MTDIEIKLYNYIKDYFTPKEKEVIKKLYYHDYTHDDTTINDPEYINIVNSYKKILNLAKSEKYRIEVDKCCADLIEKVFHQYVNQDTFVITTLDEHYTVKEVVDKCSKYNYKICTGNQEHLDKDLINRLIIEYKKSGCKNIFVLIPGVVPGFGYMIDQSFFVQLKNTLVTENIPHLMFLDDCQGVLYVQRDYSLFDGIFMTAHTLEICFQMGILLTKLSEQIGHINKVGLKRFYEKFEILAKNASKGNEFKNLLTEYFKPILSDKRKIYGDLTTSSQLNIHLINQVIPPKLALRLHNNYFFTFNENNAHFSWGRMRLHESVIQSPDKFIEGLREIKKSFKQLDLLNEYMMKDTNKIFEEEAKTLDPQVDWQHYKIINDFYNLKDKKIIEQVRWFLYRAYENTR